MTELYKVLVGGKSCHGGTLEWSLPVARADGGYDPGNWHELTGRIVVCERGLHLTSDPMQWPKVGMEVYAAEGDGASDCRKDKIAFARARLLAPADGVVPTWWRKVEKFVGELPTLPWLRPDGDPDPAWRVFATRSEGSASADASRDASRDAALWGALLVCDGLPIAPVHVAHAAARMAVWRKGYGLLGDLDGVFYVYERA